MQRELKPELLDSLAPDHPDARHNRRDLRLTNRAMGNYRWMARMLSDPARRSAKVLEIGADRRDGPAPRHPGSRNRWTRSLAPAGRLAA